MEVCHCVRIHPHSMSWKFIISIKIAEDGSSLQDKHCTPSGAGPMVPEEEEVILPSPYNSDVIEAIIPNPPDFPSELLTDY